jgi:hypothetical protein
MAEAKVLLEGKEYSFEGNKFELDGLLICGDEAILVEAKTALDSGNVRQIERTVGMVTKYAHKLGLENSDLQIVKNGVNPVLVGPFASERMLNAVKSSALNISVITENGSSFSFIHEGSRPSWLEKVFRKNGLWPDWMHTL